MTRPTLDSLSLQDLDDLLVNLDALKRAGDVVVELGMVPMFRATPGQPFAMTLDEAMPPTDQQLRDADDHEYRVELQRRRDAVRDLGRTLDDAPIVRGIDLSSQPDETATYIVTGAADGSLTFTEITDPAPGPAVEAAAVDPVQDSGGGGVQIPAAATPPAVWTPQEDTDLVGLVACLILSGVSKRQAIAQAAQQIGRPEQGAAYRIYNRLPDLLAAKLDELRAAAVAEMIETHQPDHAPPAPEEAAAEGAAGVAVFHAPAAEIAEPQPPVPTVPAVEPATGADASPAPVATVDMAVLAALSPIEAHLHGLPRKGGWTMERDHELLELICTGWNIPEISAEMSIPAGDLKSRFDLLSGLHRNAEDKLVRLWHREDLLAALTPWVKSQAAE